MKGPFCAEITPDWEGLCRCIRREGTPSRVYAIELFLDREVQDVICERYGVLDGLDAGDPYYEQKRLMAIQAFLGYDYVGCTAEGSAMTLRQSRTTDTAILQRDTGRAFIDEHAGPITNWEEFEAYPWPDPGALTTRAAEWYQANLPDNMCMIALGGFGQFTEHLTWLLGYETLCLALCEQRDLVAAIMERLIELSQAVVKKLLCFDRVKCIWGSDDMGFRGGPMIAPADLREFTLPGHRLLAKMAHDAGRPYLLHSCGNLELIMEDLIEDVKIDGKHSFEDTIEDVREDKEKYGDRIALLGGIDLDFICRATEAEVRARVRDTLETCMPGGGYCLGTGNSVTNYLPVDNYLAMLDEGRRFSL